MKPAHLRNDLLARLRYAPATAPTLCHETGRRTWVIYAALAALEELGLVRRQGTKRIGRKRAYLFYAMEDAS